MYNYENRINNFKTYSETSKSISYAPFSWFNDLFLITFIKFIKLFQNNIKIKIIMYILDGKFVPCQIFSSPFYYEKLLR